MSKNGVNRLIGVWRADLLEASVLAWPPIVLSWYLDDDYACPWILLLCAVVDRFIRCTLVCRCGSCVRVVEVLSFVARPFSGKENICSRVRCRTKPCWAERWLWASRGGSWRDVPTTLLHPAILWLIWWARLQKEWLDGCLFPITLPVTVRLGESAAGALNALVPVPASCGGRRPHARGPLTRTSLFPYSTVVVRSSPSRFAWRSFRVRGYGCR